MNLKNNTLTISKLLAIGFIFVAVTVAWLVLGGKLSKRNDQSSARAKGSVTGLWGPIQSQSHPRIWTLTTPQQSKRSYVQPTSSLVDVKLSYEPKKKGLSWNRTYGAEFSAVYQIENKGSAMRTYYISFPLPSKETSYHDFVFQIGDDVRKDIIPDFGEIKQAVTIPAGKSTEVKVSYRSRGIDRWAYNLGNVDRIQNFKLNMATNFQEIDFPDGSSSPTSRDFDKSSDMWTLVWNYPDVIRPQGVAMEMPKAKDPGPIAAKVSFFAPVSLLFFFAVLIIFGLIKGISLHPMNYVFLAAGFFAFHLLFAYLVDLVPLHLAFIIASAVSLGLIGSYVRALGGKVLTKIALPAQFAYLVLFSYSFLFDGVTGLTIAIGSIATLALVMSATAKIDWSEVFAAGVRKREASPTPQVQ